MDEETRQAFASLTRLMNDQHERLIDQISALKQDFQNTKGFLIEDALVIGQACPELRTGSMTSNESEV